MKYLFKDFNNKKLAIVENIKDGIKYEWFGLRELENYFTSLLTQPYVTTTGDVAKDGVTQITESIILKPSDSNFLSTIVADAFQLGFDVEEIK